MKLNDILWKTGVYMNLGETNNRHHIDLVLSNTTRQKYLITLPGSLLDPGDPKYQRLFVAGSHDGPSQFHLSPHGERRIRLATVCMDENLKDPVLGLKFEVSSQEGPKRLLRAALGWNSSQGRCDNDKDFISQDRWGDKLRDVQLVAHGKVK